LAYDCVLAWLWWQVTSELVPVGLPRQAAVAIVYLWIFLVCRLVKYGEHFLRYPADIIYAPLVPLFGYFHASFIKLHAMVTLQVTTWGSREGADANDRARMIPLPSYEISGDASSPIKAYGGDEDSDIEDDSTHHDLSEEQPLLDPVPRYQREVETDS